MITLSTINSDASYDSAISSKMAHGKHISAIWRPTGENVSMDEKANHYTTNLKLQLKKIYFELLCRSIEISFKPQIEKTKWQIEIQKTHAVISNKIINGNNY